MKRLLCVLTVFVMLFGIMSTAAFAAEPGTTYYVDSVNGSDLSDGTTEAKAWKSLERASAQTYSAGDSILFNAGQVFTGSFTAHGDGSAEYPVTLGAYGDTENKGMPLLLHTGTDTLMSIVNVSHWVIEDLEMSSPDGSGIRIWAEKYCEDITVRNCSIHNVWYHQTQYAQGSRAAIYMGALGVGAMIKGLTLSGLNIYNCGYALHMHGNTMEWGADTFVSPEVSYSQNWLFEGLAISDILYDAMAICSVNNLNIRNCSIIDTCLNDDYYTAPLWMHHAKNVLVEHCEIAGSRNQMDGMTVDFDGWTTDSTYQYIYSHDNVRFMQNCVYDDTTRNRNCTVRYCLSVRDNILKNNNNLLNSSAYTDSDNPTCMENLRFYNNTIIDGSQFDFAICDNSMIQNNIFCGGLYAFVTAKPISITNADGSETDKYKTFGGVISNNCYYLTEVPHIDFDSCFDKPLFAGTDYDDINSFMLSSNSPLIGAGVRVEKNMGTQDFYGNPINADTVHNIGCYEGSGVDDGQTAGSFDNLLAALTDVLGRIMWFYTLIAYLF